MISDNIQSVKKVNSSTSGELVCYRTVTKDATTHFVPHEIHNVDYQAIVEWAKIDGNNIADAD